MGWRKRGTGGEESYTPMYKTKKSPPSPNQTNKKIHKTKRETLQETDFLNKVCQVSNFSLFFFFFLRADAKCLSVHFG